MNQSNWGIRHNVFETTSKDAMLVQSNYPAQKLTVFYCFPCGYPKNIVNKNDICYWRIKSLKTKTEQ
jgi:hypothetical protein